MGKHNKLGEGERKVRLGQNSLPNIAISVVAETIYVVLPGPVTFNFSNLNAVFESFHKKQKYEKLLLYFYHQLQRCVPFTD